jgi:hypothetical protein
MDSSVRTAIVNELEAAFGEAVDKTPAEGQPAHVLLPRLRLLPGWKPNPARAVVRFTPSWPAERPEFFIDLAVTDLAGIPPRNSGGNPSQQVLVLGETWRQFSFNFSWPSANEFRTPTRAVQLWLTRFRDAA